MKKAGFIEPKNTSFYCAATIKQFMTMNPLNTQYTIFRHMVCNKGQETFLMGSTQPMRVA